MALGGGTFLVQNKVLPGAYINFISVAQASATLSDRGIVTIPLAMNWGPEGKIFTVEQADFIKNSQKIFGYAYTADELKPMREIFLHAKTVHFFRLGSSGVKASNTYATAKYPGARGNDLRVVITANENSTEQKPLFDVETFLGTVQVDLQEGVAAITGLKANDYLDWKSSGTLSLTASLPLTGGTNGTVADSDYQTYLDQAEAYTFNAMGCTESKATITALFAAFAKRMRDDVGKKFQVVLFRKLADYEGVVSVKNGLTSDKTSTALIPWVTGVIGGTAVNKSATNMTYDGEYDVDTDFTQTQLENGIREGSFMFHRVDEAVCVLTDINSFISITDEKSSDFSSNQTIRVLDQIANDIAVLFGKKYLGKVPNDAAGRISLWNDIVKHHTELQDIRAIENFSGENVTVEKGDTKKSVVVTDYVTPVNAMEQLYNPVEVVKRAAVEAVEAGKPVNILFGTVLSASPLKIQVDQKSIYTSKMLILTRNVTDFEVDMTVNHSTEDKGGGSGAAAYEAHKHAYVGKKTFKVHNALKAGEKVLLIRVQQGKKFVVIDRVKGA